MKEKLGPLFKDIEARENIKILFAIENGSRAWKLNSKDSDFDIRFVFVRPQLDYLTINKKPEVIARTYDKNLEYCPQKGCYVDMEGFDIFKFCKMLSSSNPTVIEWLMSDIVYYGEQPEILLEWTRNNFNPVSLYWHYKSMCKQNYEKYIKARDKITYKKYLYAMRGLINAIYVSTFDKIPPIDFIITFRKLHAFVPYNILKTLEIIIDKKKSGKEKDIEGIIPDFDNYIEWYLRSDKGVPTRKVIRYDKELNNYIKSLWSMGD